MTSFNLVIGLATSDPPTPAVTASPDTVAINLVIRDVVRSADNARVRHVLLTVCSASSEASRVVQDLLLVTPDKVGTKAMQKDYDSDVGEEDEDQDEKSDNSDGYDVIETRAPRISGSGQGWTEYQTRSPALCYMRSLRRGIRR